MMDFNAPLYRFRLLRGVFVHVYDTGEVEIGMVHPVKLFGGQWRINLETWSEPFYYREGPDLPWA
jgi:hypothetical protein